MEYIGLVFNIDEELIRLSTHNYTLNMDLEETEFENKMFKLQNDILRDDIESLEKENYELKMHIKSLDKFVTEIVKKNTIFNNIIERIIKKYNILFKMLINN
tara:strand:+ start:256 stop:561 length:306 start_codon:yes stop_codon:yes gene_type:complete